MQQLLEIAPVAAATTWVTRRPPVFREGPFDEERGRAAVALVEERVREGLPPRSVVSVTGLPMTAAVRRGRESGVLDRLPLFERIAPDRRGLGRRPYGHADIDPVGHRVPGRHRPSRAAAAARARRRHRMEGTRAVRDPRVHLVGYGPSASTIGANRAGRAAVRDIRRLLAGGPRAGYTAPDAAGSLAS